MATVYTATTKQGEDWWIGWIEEVPGVNCQERTRDALLASLKTTLAEALEFNRQDAIAATEADYGEETTRALLPHLRIPEAKRGLFGQGAPDTRL